MVKHCYYNGAEPSPKGLGKCAHESAVGDMEKGRDGNIWVVDADRNGRLFWKRARKTAAPERITTKKKRVSMLREGLRPLKKAGGMHEARAVVNALLKSETLQAHYEEGDPSPDAVQYFPQANMRLLWARAGTKSQKGFVVGQLGFAPSLGVVYVARYTGRPEVLSQEEIEEVAYPGVTTRSGERLWVTGSGADPVFEIL